MKIENWRVIDDTLENVICNMYKISYTKDTTEDENWTSRFEKVLDEIKCLKEEMIFTFKIED